MFQGLSLLHSEIILLSAKLCYTFEVTLFFLPTQFYEKSCSKLSKNEPVSTFKEIWCVGLGQEGLLCEGEGIVWDTLKGGGIE